jgi:hypothetical protein
VTGRTHRLQTRLYHFTVVQGLRLWNPLHSFSRENAEIKTGPTTYASFKGTHKTLHASCYHENRNILDNDKLVNTEIPSVLPGLMVDQRRNSVTPFVGNILALFTSFPLLTHSKIKKPCCSRIRLNKHCLSSYYRILTMVHNFQKHLSFRTPSIVLALKNKLRETLDPVIGASSF